MASLLRSILSIFSGKLAGILISLAFTPILVRIVSRADYGLYASILAGFSIITLLSRGGLFDATRKIVAENNNDTAAVLSVILTALIISILYAALATALIFVIIQIGLIPSRYTPFVWILATTLLFTNIFATVRGVFYGFQQESISEILNVSRQLLYAILALILAYIGYDVVGVFTGYALSFILLGVLGIVVLFKFSLFSIGGTHEFHTYAPEIVRYGGFQLIGGLSATLLYKADIILVETFRGSTSTALYQSAIVPAEMIWFVPSVIQLAFLQRSASLWKDNNIEEINSNIRLGIKYGVLSLTLFGGGLFVLSEPFLAVYFGSEYTSAAFTLKLLIFGTFFLGISRTVVPVLQATGSVKESELVTVGGLLINVLLNVLLIPRYGILGAGIGTTISYIAIFLGNVVIWFQSPFDLVPFRWVSRLIFVQAVFFSVFATLVYVSNFSPLITLSVFPAVGFLIFFVVNLYAGYIPKSAIEDHLKTRIDYL
ncbi:oligosaccharide flippase family protein [Haloprofundus sp. MHR1]|uniref:oligosaccharide flippase family protein n=1 Tax=Haloprofundus sp. MHR1 TaxID=2572921 RepID=UPI0010BE2F96|nr:oligosaccharide flippase family protein [Haloprofundus sp. MHR1]QCJ45973.1 polysaccharide biosynthesis protein [Haloprofundus sp. MHR1]